MSLDNILDSISPTDPRIPFKTINDEVPAGEDKQFPISAQYLGAARAVRIKNNSSAQIEYRTQGSQMNETIPPNTVETIEEWVKNIIIYNKNGSNPVPVGFDLVTLDNIRRFVPNG